MPEDSRRASVARAHIAALTFGWGMEQEHLALALTRGCWPGTERTEPAARGWVRSWGPPRHELRPPACECHAGACLICN